MQKLIQTLSLAVFLLATFWAKAQDADLALTVGGPIEKAALTSTEDNLPEEIPTEAEADKGLSITGFVDGYYMYNFNETGFPTSFTEVHNSFNLGMANVVFSKEGKVGFVADLAVGPRAEVANGYTGTTLAAIKQLYVTYSPAEAVTLTFGNFGTFVGYEIIDAPGNVNYSTSYLFSNGPFYHTGLKADFVLGENLGAMIGIFNDTDGKFDEVAGKHLGVQLSTTQGGLSAYLNVLYGKEAEGTDGAKDTNGFQVDLTATYDVSDKLMLGLNVSNKSSANDGEVVNGFFGTAAYATIGISETFNLGLRGEYFALTDGIEETDDDSVIAVTVSGNIFLGEALTLIPEFRYDTSNNDFFFLDGDGAFTGTNGAFLLAAVYSF